MIFFENVDVIKSELEYIPTQVVYESLNFFILNPYLQNVILVFIPLEKCSQIIKCQL